MDEQDLQECRDLKLKEAEKTIANKDVIINMLQQQVKKLQESFRNKLDETESYRNRYCLANEQIKKLRCKANPVKHAKQILNLSCEGHEPPPCSENCPLRMQIPCNYLPQIKNIENFMKAYYDLLQTLTAKLANQEQPSSKNSMRDELSRQYLEEINKLKEEIEYLREENARLQAGPSRPINSSSGTGLKAKDSFIDAYKRSAHVLQKKISTLVHKEPSLLLELEDDEDKLPIVEDQDNASKKISFNPPGAEGPGKSLLKPESEMSIRGRRSASQVHITTATIIHDTDSLEMAVNDMTEDDQYDAENTFYGEDNAENFSETNSQFSKKEEPGLQAPCVCKSQERLITRKMVYGENPDLTDQDVELLSLQSHCSCEDQVNQSTDDSRSSSPSSRKEKDYTTVKRKSSYSDQDKNKILMLKEVKDDTHSTVEYSYDPSSLQTNKAYNSEILKKLENGDQIHRRNSEKNAVKILVEKKLSLNVEDLKKGRKVLCNCEAQTSQDPSLPLRPCACSRRQSMEFKEGPKIQNKRVSLNMESKIESSSENLCNCEVQTSQDAGPSFKPSIQSTGITATERSQMYDSKSRSSREARPSEDQNQNLFCCCDQGISQGSLKPCSCAFEENAGSNYYQNFRNQTGQQTCICRPKNMNKGSMNQDQFVSPSKEHVIKTHTLDTTSSIGIQCICPKSPTESESDLLQQSEEPRISIKKVPSDTMPEKIKKISSDKSAEKIRSVSTDKSAEKNKRLSYDKSADKNRRVSSDKIAENIRKPSFDKNSEKIRRVSSDKSVENIRKPSSDKRAENIRKPSSDKNSEKIRRVSSDKSVENIRKPSSDKRAENIRKPSSDKNSEKIRRVSSDKSVENIRKPSSDKRAENIKRPSFDKNSEKIRRVSSDKSAENIRRVSSSKSADTIRRSSFNRSAEKLRMVSSNRSGEKIKTVIPCENIVEKVGGVFSDRSAEKLRMVSSNRSGEKIKTVIPCENIVENVGGVSSDRSAEKIRMVSSNRSGEKIKTVIPCDNIVEKVGGVSSDRSAEKIRRVSSDKSVEKMRRIPSEEFATKNVVTVEETPRFSLIPSQSESVGSHKRMLEAKLEEIKTIIGELYDAQNSAQEDLNLLREEILTVNDCCKICNDKISKLAEMVVYQKDTIRETLEDPKSRVDELVRKNNQIQQDIQALNSKVDILIKASQTEGVNKTRYSRNAEEDCECDDENMVKYKKSPLRMEECVCEPQNEPQFTACVDNIKGENLKLKTSISCVIEQLNSKINAIKCVLVKKTSLERFRSPDYDALVSNPGPSTELEIEDIYNTVRNTFMPERQHRSSTGVTCCCSENAVGRCGSFTCCRGNPTECLDKFLNMTCSSPKVNKDACDPCKEDFLYNLETYIQYLHDQLNIISCVEDKIDELKHQIKNP